MLGDLRAHRPGDPRVGDQRVDLLQRGEANSGPPCPTWCGPRPPPPGVPTRTNCRLVSASARLGVDSPASTEMPCTPRNSTSKWSERIARSATGPTSESDGVRTPPVSTTVAAPPGRAAARAGARCAVWKTSATRTELVTTVRSGTSSRWWASANVVVPPDRAIALPGCDQRGGRPGDVLLGGQLQRRLGLEPRLVGTGLDHRHRAAVHLLHHALAGERVEVPAYGHVRDVELAGQLVDPDPAAPPDLVEDQGAPLLREQVLVVGHPWPVLPLTSPRRPPPACRRTPRPHASRVGRAISQWQGGRPPGRAGTPPDRGADARHEFG